MVGNVIEVAYKFCVFEKLFQKSLIGLGKRKDQEGVVFEVVSVVGNYVVHQILAF